MYSWVLWTKLSEEESRITTDHRKYDLSYLGTVNKSILSKKLGMKKKIFTSFSLPNNKPRLGIISNKSLPSNNINNTNDVSDNLGDSPDKKNLFNVVKNDNTKTGSVKTLELTGIDINGEYSGKVVAGDEVVVGPKIPGKVETVNVSIARVLIVTILL